jgi:cytochrome c1
MNQYLAAVVKHDPKGLPLSEDAMYTENDQVMKVGDGFWKTAEAIGNYKHYFADPEFGQVAFMGTMHEAGAPLLLSLRLRIELGRITEIESVYFRSGGGGPNNIAGMETAKVDDLWFKSIPPAQRAPRQQMIATADAYFSGLQKNDGKGVNGTGTYPFTSDCHRIENGSPTTNVPNTTGPFGMDCLSAFKMGYYFVVQAVHGRRYPLVDAERGIVWAHCVFDQGTVNSGTLSNGQPYRYPGFNRPGSILVTEAFLIDGAKIRRVEMIGPAAVYHINSPWGGLTGN